MTQQKRGKKPRLSDLPSELRGPPQNRFGGHRTQKMRTYPGNTFGAASECRVLTPAEKVAWAQSYGVSAGGPLPKPSHRPELDMKRELYHWFKTFDWDIAFTLTFPEEYSERQIASAVRRFWKEVDYLTYKNASRRANKRVQRVMMLEGDGIGSHIHYHGAVIVPRDQGWDQSTFCSILLARWNKVNPDCKVVEFKPTFNTEGWSWYMTKKTSPFDCDSFDVHSSHIAAPNSPTAPRA